VSDELGKPNLKESETAAIRGGAPVRRWVPGTDVANEGAKDNKDNKDNKNSSAVSEDGRPGRQEIGGRKGPDPTRFGDWEIKGRCIDF
jgi:hypothetical protein